MLLHMKRGLTAALILTLTLTLGVPALAADPLAGGGFAQVAISAKNSDSPTLDLDLALYRRNSSNAFTKVESMDYVTPVNRLTKDMTFNLTPQAKQVTLTVDYLTDLNGDGLYELLSSQEAPVCDVLTSSGVLTAASSGVSTALTAGKTYTLTAGSLLKRGQAALQDRTASGSASHLSGMTGGQTAADSILYMITVNYHSALTTRTMSCATTSTCLTSSPPPPPPITRTSRPARGTTARWTMWSPRACSPAPAEAAFLRSSP